MLLGAASEYLFPSAMTYLPSALMFLLSPMISPFYFDSCSDLIFQCSNIIFYSCKKLEPVWNELGQAYANDDTLVIAKMDGTSFLDSQMFFLIYFLVIRHYQRSGWSQRSGLPYYSVLPRW